MPDGGPSPERIRAALDELLGWQGIARSPQLAELLRYVVEKALNGDAAGIKAYAIAVDVFRRPPDFDPQSDPIVRVQARRLRTLLEQFYEGRNSRTDVQIHLPLGRYVPEFRSVDGPPATVESPPGDLPPTPIAEVSGRSPLRLSRFLLNAIFGLTFTLVGVGLTVAIIRWVLPAQTPVVFMPTAPRITVGDFDNLTGVPVLDDDIHALGQRVRDSLMKFDEVAVGDDGLLLTATVQEMNGQFSLRATLTDPASSSPLWTSTILGAATGGTDTEVLTIIGNRLASQLGHSNGPLFASGRAWMKLQTTLPEAPSSYVCFLLYMKWRDTRSVAGADEAGKCFDKVLSTSPNDAVAVAAAAGMRAWRIQYLATPSDDLATLMSGETVAVGRAVQLKPDSSFVYEQQAIVLVRQGSLDAALGSIQKARELNPASMDAEAALGQMTWADGRFEEAGRYAEEALATAPTPPSWYYMVRALNALKEQRFFDAIDAAQALASGDEEFGPAIALAAAPRAGRQDLIDRYRPMVMGNAHYQVAGILPRLSMRLRAESVFDQLRQGLILAGVPPGALEGPFNPDGSPNPPRGL